MWIWWFQMDPAPECCVHVGKKSIKDEVMHPSCWCQMGACEGQLEDTWGASFTFNSSGHNIFFFFFLSWWYRRIPRWQCQDSTHLNCERALQGAWDWSLKSSDLNAFPKRWDVLEKTYYHSEWLSLSKLKEGQQNIKVSGFLWSTREWNLRHFYFS